jgi:DNA-binding transcriptional LysR family regulator
MYDLRRLRVFHAVAERRSFSEAALALGYAQSVVSHHVAELEQEFGLTLVDRTRRPVGLTDAGARLFEHAETILGHVATAEEELHAIAGLLGGRLRVGAFLTACTSFVPSALARFEAAHPEVEVELEQIEPVAARRRLRAGELDLAVTWEDPFGDADGSAEEGFERRPLGDDPYRIVLPRDHRLAHRRRVRMADLAGERFNAPRPDNDQAVTYHGMLERVCAEAGFRPNIAYVMSDVTVARAFVAAGLCVAVMPELAIDQPRPDVAVRPLPGLEPSRPVQATWVRGRRLPAIPAMAQALAEAAATRLGDGRVG